jgi:hypothetical protein
MKNIIFILALALPACAGVQSPQETVFATRSAQNVALRAAVEYKHLSPCATPAKQPCSDPAIVAQLQKADTVSDQALGAAETAVRTPGFGTEIISSAVTAAKAALAAFQAIITVIGGK